MRVLLLNQFNTYETKSFGLSKAHRQFKYPRGYRFTICYSGRTYGEGKQIGWRDAFAAIGAIIHYCFAD